MGAVHLSGSHTWEITRKCLGSYSYYKIKPGALCDLLIQMIEKQQYKLAYRKLSGADFPQKSTALDT